MEIQMLDDGPKGGYRLKNDERMYTTVYGGVLGEEALHYLWHVNANLQMKLLIAVRESNVPNEWGYSTSIVIRLWSCSEFACHDEMRESTRANDNVDWNLVYVCTR